MDIVLKKIPRNQSCPCGSQKKFKRCHGIENLYWPPLEVAQAIKRREIIEKERQQREGFGRPIISVPVDTHRLIAVGNVIIPFKGKTFHDFLLVYIRHVLGADFGNKELKKPYPERHIILQWYNDVCEYQRQTRACHQFSQMTIAAK